MKVTIKRIAELAGVSKTTVSFAFNDPSKIARLTYERIMAIADREGYVPDPVARTMTTKRVGAIGVLLPQAIQDAFRNLHLTEVLRGIGTVCHQQDLFLTILPPIKGFLSHAIRNAAVDGFIALGVEAAPPLVDLIRLRHVPFVTIDGDAELGVPNVGIDDASAAETATNHLLSLGNPKLAILSLEDLGPGSAGERSSRTVARRLAGVRRALEAHGRTFDEALVDLIRVDASVESAAAAAGRVLERGPAAFVCMSDSAAYGVYEAAKRRGLSIPGDVSVVGMDDVPFSSYLSPPLTTVRQDGMQKGSLAVRLIVDLLQGRPAASILLPTELIIRGSTARP